MNSSAARSLRSLPRAIAPVRGGMRFYSSPSGEKSPFLTDILARIEKINLNKNLIKKPTESKTKNSSKGTQNKSSQQSSSAPTEVKRPTKIVFDQHPMFSSRLDKTKFSKDNKVLDATQRTSRGPRKATGTAPRKPTQFKKSSGPKKPLRASKSDSSTAIISREAVSKSYRPSLANQFLYGKATNLQISLTSRITSVIKSQLLNSKYPFNLPKSIIDNAPETAENKFILSKSSFSLELDENKVKNDIDTIIKGEGQYVEVKSVAEQSLNKNPTMSYEQKLQAANIVNAKSLKNVFDNAHWNQ